VWEKKFYYATLDNFQQTKEKAERDINNYVAICAQPHRITHILTHKGNQPSIEALRNKKSNECIFEEV
jgi:hypothetical protein